MFEVNSDLEKNCLYITLRGVINAEDAKGLRQQVLDALEQLADGFHVISDMSEANCGYVSCLPLFQEVITAISSHHVGRVIRIVGESVFQCQINAASQQFARYSIEQAASREAAEAMLVETATSEPS